ncbi:hypothetical protein GWI34_24955 [Actinomadura sp. DSM 109109]|nr:hypothetical protein [Actinomadura lepetitiana]
MVMAANIAGIANGYILVASGVTDHVGPITTALIGMACGTPVMWYFFRPALRSKWSAWRPSLLLGIALGVNHVTFQYGLRWVQVQLLQPLSFLFTVLFTVGPDIVRDARNGRYSIALWPVVGLLGIWALSTDTADGTGGAAFTDAVPHLHLLGWPVPAWVPALGVMVITAATSAYGNWRLEEARDLAGKYNTLAGLPAIAVLVAGVWLLEDGWAGVVGAPWPYLLVSAVCGMFFALLSGVVTAKAYGEGLRKSTTAMLQPLRHLLGTLLGMAVARTAPGPLGLAAILLITVASLGAAVVQGRNSGSG